MSAPVHTTPLTLDPARPVHFIGVGGIGMSGLAKVLLESGFKVSGSDQAENDRTRQLKELGGQIYQGHQAEHVPEGALVVASTAVGEDNPELEQAREQDLTVAHRSDVLQALLEGPEPGHLYTVGISGSHGKTSVTGMVGVALSGAGMAPTIIAGGVIPELGTNAVLGAGKVAVAELDESDRSLLRYRPSHSAILNLELDHPEHFPGGFEDFMNLFRRFLDELTPDNTVLFNLSCPHTRELFEEYRDKVSPVVLEGKVSGLPGYRLDEVKLKEGTYSARIMKNNEPLARIHMGVPGRHQLFNALVAVAVGDQLGADVPPMVEALERFRGMGRRFEIVDYFNGATLVDDYAHHPTEVRATLASARELMQGEGRLIAIFQPHRYTRLSTLWEEFLTCFEGADTVYVTDVYSAGEPPIEAVNSEAFARLLEEQSGSGADVRYYAGADWEPLRRTLRDEARKDDLVISMGAGSVTQLLRGWTP